MSKVVLFDADSLAYQAVYKVVTFGEIRALLQKEESRYAIELEILQRGYDRFEKMYFDIHNEIEETYNVTDTLYYFTNCKNSFRKKIEPTYKANRKSNKWVSELRKYLLEYLPNSFASDEYEADDLIYFQAQNMNIDDYIICSIDKDLKQIVGPHFDYYQMKVKDENGQYILDSFGKEVKKRKGFLEVTQEQAEHLIFEMMLVGDVSDNIKGIYGIGKVKANKILLNRSKYGKFRAICEEYKKESNEWKTRIKINAQLLMFN